MSHSPGPAPSRRRARTFGAVVAGLAAMAMWASVPTVDAEPVEVSVDQVGWWTDRPVAAPAGEGGFEVASGPDGQPQSVAAFQVTIPAAQVDRFDLTLVETAGFGSQFGSLALCRTEESWAPADPGDLADAPVADCSTRLFLTPVLEERTWIGDVSSLVADGGTVSLVVTTDYAPPVPIGPGMIVRISEIQIDAEGSSEPETTTTTTLDFSTPGGANQFDVSPDSGFTAGPAPIVDLPAPGAVDVPATPDPATDAGAPETAAGDGDDDGFFALEPVAAGDAERRPWARLLVIAPLSAGIGIGSARLRRLLVPHPA